MKMNKRKIFVVALAVCMVAILSFGTLAWFNASDEVKNTFLVADSDNNNVPDFDVDVWENDGTTSDPMSSIVYPDILPGDSLTKNVYIENTGDYDQYIRVYVTFSDYTKLSAAQAKYNLSADLTSWLDLGNKWVRGTTARKVDANADTVTYCFYLNEVLEKDTVATNVEQLFSTVTIPNQFVQEDMTFAGADFDITVKAEAVQTENIDITGVNGSCDAEKTFNKINWLAFEEYPA